MHPMIDAVHFASDDEAVNRLNDVMPEHGRLLRSVHCYQHVCVFERNELPAKVIHKKMQL